MEHLSRPLPVRDPDQEAGTCKGTLGKTRERPGWLYSGSAFLPPPALSGSGSAGRHPRRGGVENCSYRSPPPPTPRPPPFFSPFLFPPRTPPPNTPPPPGPQQTQPRRG